MYIKPPVEQEQVLSLLREHFADPILNLQHVEGGSVARTFSFTAEGRDYIIRFNTRYIAGGFEKEAYLYRTYASPRIPIPPVVHIGHFQDLHFAISHKIHGVTGNNLSWEEFEHLLPALIETIDAIHHCDVREKTGYGLFNE